MSDSSTTPIISLKGVEKSYCLSGSPVALLLRQFSYFRDRLNCRTVSALQNISLEVGRGETIGIVGKNGSGKSTLLQLISGIVPASAGEMTVNGRIAALLELGAGFNPDFSGRENIFLNAALLGMTQRQAADRYHEIVEFSEIGDSIGRAVKTYSSGMFVRLAFSVAAHSYPDILIVDEALAVGDEAFQRKCYARIRKLQEMGTTILFVTHSAATVLDVADRAVLLERGELVMDGEPKKVIAHYHRMLNKSKAPEPAKPATEADPKTEVAGGSDDLSAIDAAWFDPTLKPKSTVSYESHGAHIEAIQLLNSDQNRVNVVRTGDACRLQYRVRFDTDARNVRFGMLLKTVSGFELGGATTGKLENTLDKISSGSEVTVSFDFDARLNADVYFLNMGVSGTVDGEEVFLHRIVDGAMFRIVREEEGVSRGIVDFQISPTIGIDHD